MLSPCPKVSAFTRLNAAPRVHFPAASAAYTPHATSPTRTFTPRLRAAQTQRFNPPSCVPRGYWYFFARATSRPSSYAPKRNQQTAAKRLQDQLPNVIFPPLFSSITSQHFLHAYGAFAPVNNGAFPPDAGAFPPVYDGANPPIDGAFPPPENGAFPP